jgi:HSP20 family protein
MPSADQDGIDITAMDATLLIGGSRKPEELKKGQNCHHRERGHGPFSKKAALPFHVESDKVDASYEKGGLLIRLARPEEEKRKKNHIENA